MICRKCGIEIADKALICYRCGTATAEAKFKPPAPRRSSSVLVVSALLMVLLVAVAFLVDRASPAADGSARLLPWLVVAVAVVIVGLRAFLRRR